MLFIYYTFRNTLDNLYRTPFLDDEDSTHENSFLTIERGWSRDSRLFTPISIKEYLYNIPNLRDYMYIRTICHPYIKFYNYVYS